MHAVVPASSPTRARAGGCVALGRLEARISNPGELRLYGRHGFVVVGRRPRYYGDGKDALLLEHPRHREVTP